MADVLQVLKKYFGHNDFRAGQKEVIDAIIQGKDVLAVMPTGAGKSICFQVPALMMDGITLVISPLISLMKDQISALSQSGVHAAYINSTLTQSQMMKVYDHALNGDYKLIYVAPERLLTAEFLAFSKLAQISFIAVDEAHCVSQWGQDFRPSYLTISSYIKKLQTRPIVAAFTATATPMVKADIQKLLSLKKPFSITTGFDRPNLFFSVETPKKKMERLIEFLTEHEQESGIVYCSTRKKVEEVTLKLCEEGFSAARYHAGLDDEERKRNQEDFSNDDVQIIVATNAFGMGIDKSNVSFVVHYNMPKNIESYYQEAGRAGRDGSPANCLLLYGKSDIVTVKRFIMSSNQNEFLTEDQQALVRKEDLRKLDQMVEYCTTDVCLRGFILRYFGEQAPDACGKCGNCIKTKKLETVIPEEIEEGISTSYTLYQAIGDYTRMEYPIQDITIYAQKILSGVVRAQNFHPDGISRTALVRMLYGSTEKRQHELGLDTLSTYGIIRDIPRKTITQFVDYLEELGFVSYAGGNVTVLPEARNVLFEGQKVYIHHKYIDLPERKNIKKPKKKRTRTSTEQGETLYMMLKALRTNIAQKENMPAFVVFSNATLLDMAQRKPKTRAQMLKVNGVGELKLERYGDAFLNVIKTWEKIKK